MYRVEGHLLQTVTYRRRTFCYDLCITVVGPLEDGPTDHVLRPSLFIALIFSSLFYVESPSYHRHVDLDPHHGRRPSIELEDPPQCRVYCHLCAPLSASPVSTACKCSVKFVADVIDWIFPELCAVLTGLVLSGTQR